MPTASPPSTFAGDADPHSRTQITAMPAAIASALTAASTAVEVGRRSTRSTAARSLRSYSGPAPTPMASVSSGQHGRRHEHQQRRRPPAADGRRRVGRAACPSRSVAGRAPEHGDPDLEDREQGQQADHHGDGEDLPLARPRRGVEQPELGDEPGERRDAGQAQRRQQEEHGDDRRRRDHVAEAVQPARPVGVLDQAADEEQRRLDDDVVDDGVHRAGQPGDREQPEAHDDVADLGDDVEGEDPLDVLLGDRPEHADDHRRAGDDEDQRRRPAVGGEQQRLGADDGVDADLGEQSGEDRGHRPTAPSGSCRAARSRAGTAPP